MLGRIGVVVGQLKQPAYTGPNRCLPCTVLNLAITIIIGLALATVSLPAAAVAMVVCSVIIYLRGYLVPGTPTFTARYAPPWLLAPFGKGSQRGTKPSKERGENEATEESVTEVLEALGAVTDCEIEEDLRLTNEFREEWDEQIDDIDGEIDPDRFARALGIDRGRITIDDTGLPFLEVGDGHQKQWAPRGATIADIAAAELLAENLDWSKLPLETREGLLSGLRIVLERCPLCRGVVGIGQEQIGCCDQRYVVACTDCGESLASVGHEQV